MTQHLEKILEHLEAAEVEVYEIGTLPELDWDVLQAYTDIRKVQKRVEMAIQTRTRRSA